MDNGGTMFDPGWTCSWSCLVGMAAKSVARRGLRYPLDRATWATAIISLLHKFYVKSAMGYTSNAQEDQSKSNMAKLRNVMCFIEEYWKAFLRAEFSCIPEDADDTFIPS